MAAPRRACIIYYCGLSALRFARSRSFNSKLFQEAHVVLKEQLEIVDVVLQHRVTLDTASESEAGILLRIIVDEPVQVRMHHPGAHHFNPSCSFANTAAGAAAEHAGNIDLRSR